GCVRPLSRAAADREPLRSTARKDLYRLQSGALVIDICIAIRLASPIFFYHVGGHPALDGTQLKELLMTTTRTALILGATGGIGGEVAHSLGQRGWRINALNRDPSKVRGRIAGTAPINWIQGDAMNPADVLRGAESASLIVHAVNPPGYRNWSKL